MEFCIKCGEIDWENGKHLCLPVFEAQFKDDFEDNNLEEIYARDEEGAAEKFAEKDDRDSADYSIVSGGEAEIWVRRLGSEEIKKFIVSGQSVPEYHATAIE